MLTGSFILYFLILKRHSLIATLFLINFFRVIGKLDKVGLSIVLCGVRGMDWMVLGCLATYKFIYLLLKPNYRFM